jgi:hypothetical protein
MMDFRFAGIGLSTFLFAWFLSIGAFLGFSQSNYSPVDHPVWVSVVYWPHFVMPFGWGVVSLVYNRAYALELKLDFERMGMERTLRRLLKALGIETADQLPRYTAAFHSVTFIVVAVVCVFSLVVRCVLSV